MDYNYDAREVYGLFFTTEQDKAVMELEVKYSEYLQQVDSFEDWMDAMEARF